MSKTDKDVPYRVRLEREGEVQHNHEHGPCSLGNPNTKTRYEWNSHRSKKCAKRVTVAPVCTKAEPWVSRNVWGGNASCWRNNYEYTYNKVGDLIHVERTWVQCVGHKDETYFDKSIPCVCDAWVHETCRMWGTSKMWANHRGDLPNPSRRAKVKAKLKRALKGDDIEITDPPKIWRD